ncbi:envelope stress response membrane protein PspB [Thermaurantiacus sp.]
MEDFLIPLIAILALFVGLPWLVLHYITKWKQASTLTLEDENLLDELHELARKLDERVTVIERIHAADRALEAPDETPRIAAIRPRALGKDV